MKKISNFFYYYKYYIIAGVVILLIAGILIHDTVAKKESDTADMKIILVDDSSALDIESGENLVKDFLQNTGLSEKEGTFMYHSMFMEQSNFDNINLEIAGVEDYEKCLVNGTIDLIILPVNELVSYTESSEEAETEAEYIGKYSVAKLTDIFTEAELKEYEKSIYYVNGDPIGIIFDNTKKAKEFYGDNYPSDYHYILQIAKGAKENEYVKKFIDYLIEG